MKPEPRQPEGGLAIRNLHMGEGFQMRVRDLLEVLSGVDPSLEVLAHAEHGECRFQFFDIQSAEQARALRSRSEEGQPHVALNHDAGRPLLVLTLTSEF